MPYWRLYYHIVWGTKNREPLIQPAWELSLHNAIAAKATELGALVHAVGGVEDHVHLVASVPPRIALSQFVGQIKGNSTHFVNHELLPAPGFAWQAAFGVVSFGLKNLDTVVRYTHNQRQHHLSGTTIAFLETMNDDDADQGQDHAAHIA